MTVVRVEQSKLAEQLSAAQRQVRQIEIARADVERQHKVIDEQLKQHHRRTEEHERVAEEARNVSLQASAELDQLEGALEGVREKVAAVEEVLNELRSGVQQARKAAEAADQLVHQLHIEKRELEVKCEGVCQRAAEQLNLDVVAKYNEIEQARALSFDGATPQAADDSETQNSELETQNSPTVIDWAAVEQEIHDLKTKLDRWAMSISMRSRSRTRSKNSSPNWRRRSRTSRTVNRNSNSSSSRSTRKSRTRFEATFHQIKENFAGQNGLFRKLFGGGRADVFCSLMKTATSMCSNPASKSSRNRRARNRSRSRCSPVAKRR